MTIETNESPCRWAWTIVWFVAIAGWALPALAEEDALDGACKGEDSDQYQILDIEVRGLVRTREFVIHRELTVEEGDTVGCPSVLESVRRLQNTNLFRTVDYALIRSEADEGASRAEDDREDDEREAAREVRLVIEVDEKWTALPNFQFSSGGGALQVLVGANETNLFGRYLAIGGHFEHVQGANSLFGWFENPRTFDERLKTRLELGTQNRVYYLYDDAGDRDGGYFRRRLTFGGSARHEWRWWLHTEAGLRFERDRFSQELIPEDQRREDDDAAIPDATDALVGRLALSFGRINQLEYLQDGTDVTLSVEHANSAVGSTHNLFRLGLSATHFEALPLKSNLAVRFQAGLSQVEALHHHKFIGGLDTLRGFPYDRFSGEHHWSLNLEYRIPSIDHPWLAIQHVAFVDAAHVGPKPADIFGLSGASTGLGLRILVPKVQNLIVRLDYALPLVGEVTNPWNVAGAQFF
ncbi:MAG: hypothetical protein ACOCV2_07005 [Persicimonas sp.]